MNKSSVTKRFSNISAVINMKKLERESMKFIYIGLVLGVFIQLLAGHFINYHPFDSKETEDENVRHMKVELITLPPSIENPYQNWKRPFTPRTYIGKIFRIAKPSGDFIYKVLDTTVNSPSDMEFTDIEQAKQYVLRNQEAYLDTLINNLDPINMDAEDYYKYRELTITRKPQDSFSLLEEMVSLDDIDALGMYKGFVIQDPTDKQNIRGYFHIPRYFFDVGLTPGLSYNLFSSVDGLSEAFNYYTGLELIVDNPTTISSTDLKEYPVVYITTDTVIAFETNDFQARNFGEYLRKDGLAIIDNGTPWHTWSQAKASLLNILLKAFENDIELKLIPRNHPLYSCFFEFDSLPPEGAEKWSPSVEAYIPNWGRLLHDPKLDELRLHVSESPASIWGVWAEERLVAIYSDKGYGHLWKDGIINNKSRDFASGSGEKYNFNPQLKLGVNMLVYALIQKGGIAKQMVDYSANDQ